MKDSKIDAIIYPTVKSLPFRIDDYDWKDFTITHNGKRVS